MDNNPEFIEKKNDNEIIKFDSINNYLNKKWSCPVCKVKMDSQHAFTVHIRQHNPTDHSNTCSICSKQLSSASSLDRHMLIHSGERPFKCRICNMAFTTNGNMHRHMRTHGQDQQKSIDIIDQEIDSFDIKKKRKKSYGNSLKKSLSKLNAKVSKKTKTSDENEIKNSSPINSSLASLLSDKTISFNNDEMTDNFLANSEKLSKNLSKISKTEKDGFLALLQLGQSGEESHFKIPHLQNYSLPQTFDDKNSDTLSNLDFSRSSDSSDDINDQESYCFQNAVKETKDETNFNEHLKKSDTLFENSKKDEGSESTISENNVKFNLDEDSFKENQNSFFTYSNQQSLSLKDLLDQDSPIKNEFNSSSLNLAKNQEDAKIDEISKNLIAFKQIYIDPMDEDDVKLLENQLQDQQYLCKVCNLEVRSVNTLRRHQRLHDSGGQLYNCEFCSYTSLDKSSLIRHLRTHNGERPYQCTICKYAFTTKANCERHVKKCHKSKVNDYSLIVHHHKQKLNESSFLPINGLSTKVNNKPKNLSTSSNLVEINKNFLASSKMHLVPHIYYEPSSIETNCRYCNVDFSFNRLLKQHLRTMCNNSFTKKPFSCSLCNQGFTNRNNCIRHILKCHEHIPYDRIHSLINEFDINKLQKEIKEQDQYSSNKNEFIKKIESFLKNFLSKKQNSVKFQNSPSGFPVNLYDTSHSKNSDVLDLSLKSTKKNDQKFSVNLENTNYKKLNDQTTNNSVDLFNKTLSSLIALQSFMIQADTSKN